MSAAHLVQLGVWGHVGRFHAADARRYPRGTRVVCRSQRGLELGRVLAAAGPAGADAADGQLLRAVTVEDELLIARLERHREEAFAACCRELETRGLSASLLEVELLLDGTTVYFHFLGTVSPQVEEIVAELAETYEAEAQIRRFADTLTAGCGPGCGTEEAEGSGCGSSCGSCAVSGACGVRPATHDSH